MVNITFIDKREERQNQQEEARQAQDNLNSRRHSTPKKQHSLPLNVQSFLRQKIMIKDQETLTRVKMLMNIRRPRKPKTSIYNQDVLRQQSRGKSRGMDDREFPDTFLGGEFEKAFQRTYGDEVRRLSLTCGSNQDGFLQLRSMEQERERRTSSTTQKGNFFGQRNQKQFGTNPNNSTLGTPANAYFNQDLVLDKVQRGFKRNLFDNKTMTPQIGTSRRMATPMQ